MQYDNETYRQLRDGLKIDRDVLDEEVISQPNEYFHASEGHVLAAARRDRKKHDLEVEVAKLDKDVRDFMAVSGERATEASVKAQINREPDFHRAHTAYLEACLEADRWEAMRNAYRQRADMLRSLVQLHQTGYFGEVTGASERRYSRERFDERRRS